MIKMHRIGWMLHAGSMKCSNVRSLEAKFMVLVDFCGHPLINCSRLKTHLIIYSFLFRTQFVIYLI